MERHQGAWDEFVRFEEPDNEESGEYLRRPPANTAPLRA